MNKYCKFVMVVISAIVFSGVFSADKSAAAEGTCYLQAARTDVYIQVFDQDRQGNMGPMVWQGRINANESVKITMPHGRLRYYYNAQPDKDQPLSGGMSRWCNNNENLLMP